MKQTILKVQVFQGTNKVHEIEIAQMSNIQSCIDLWHTPGTEIKLIFDQIDVSEESQSNVAHNV